MARCIITVADKAKGVLDIRVEFKPGLEKGKAMTPAQKMAKEMAQLLLEKAHPKSAAALDRNFPEGVPHGEVE
jgi:hypothetical protein